MRKELICLAKDDKLYVVRTKTPIYDSSNIKNCETVEDIVNELSSQNIRHSVVSFDGDGQICTFNISSLGSVNYERDIYIINKMDRGCKIIFADRFIREGGAFKGLLTATDCDETINLNFYCQSNYYKLFELDTTMPHRETHLTYMQIENVKILKEEIA